MATLTGKTVLVVGGTSGIGFAVAEAALKSQAEHVIVASSSEARVNAAVAKLQQLETGGKVSGTTANAKDDQSIKALMETVGNIDHLVWTSGNIDGLNFTFPEGDIEQAKGMFEVRFWGAMAAAKYAKIKKGGSITLTHGVSRLTPRKGWTLVGGVMGSIESATRGLAVDLAPVRVNAVSPGCIITEMWDNMMTEAEKEASFKEVAQSLLVEHAGLPHEIAEAYLFLMKCDFITGKTIEVDGGETLV